MKKYFTLLTVLSLSVSLLSPLSAKTKKAPLNSEEENPSIQKVVFLQAFFKELKTAMPEAMCKGDTLLQCYKINLNTCNTAIQNSVDVCDKQLRAKMFQNMELGNKKNETYWTDQVGECIVKDFINTHENKRIKTAECSIE